MEQPSKLPNSVYTAERIALSRENYLRICKLVVDTSKQSLISTDKDTLTLAVGVTTSHPLPLAAAAWGRIFGNVDQLFFAKFLFFGTTSCGAA
jgi:hypothetical protein